MIDGVGHHGTSSVASESLELRLGNGGSEILTMWHSARYRPVASCCRWPLELVKAPRGWAHRYDQFDRRSCEQAAHAECEDPENA